MTCEDQHSDGKDKDDTALDEDELSENESYVDNNMFSEDDYEGFAFVQDVTCNMNDKIGIPDRWILLVNQSTVDVFTNKKLLKIIYDAKQDTSMYCNAGMTTVNKSRDLPWYGMVWYFEDGIANILSLNNVKMVVLKCTKWMVPNVYLKNPKRVLESPHDGCFTVFIKIKISRFLPSHFQIRHFLPCFRTFFIRVIQDSN